MITLMASCTKLPEDTSFIRSCPNGVLLTHYNTILHTHTHTHKHTQTQNNSEINQILKHIQYTWE